MPIGTKNAVNRILNPIQGIVQRCLSIWTPENARLKIDRLMYPVTAYVETARLFQLGKIHV